MDRFIDFSSKFSLFVPQNSLAELIPAAPILRHLSSALKTTQLFNHEAQRRAVNNISRGSSALGQKHYLQSLYCHFMCVCVCVFLSRQVDANTSRSTGGSRSRKMDACRTEKPTRVLNTPHLTLSSGVAHMLYVFLNAINSILGHCRLIVFRGCGIYNTCVGCWVFFLDVRALLCAIYSGFTVFERLLY